MNIYLEKLFEKYNLSPKDRYDISQIYSLLPVEKQKNLMNNFEVLAYRIKQIEEQVHNERDILIGKALDNIGNVIRLVQQENSTQQTKGKIESLKQKI